MREYVPSVGMEVHAELATRTKMFCRCRVAFGGEPNTRVCPICIGLPGSLPVPNRAAVEMVLRTALALKCTIAMRSVFHRKNYFYPDLPKGYQISQYGDTNPIGYGGFLDVPAVNGGSKRIRIRRVHLEEDTGKLMHLPSSGSGIDYNRAGVPLMEIVTEFPPDISTADEAKEYLVQLRQILLYLGVCDGKMEEGSLRCEPNISVRPAGSDAFGTKTELKNLNSFRSVQLGVDFEVRRQIAALEQGEQIRQETRGWNEQTESSFVMRTKETEQDYRYFPDPDLVPMAFSDAQIEVMRDEMPELPLAKARRLSSEFGLVAKEIEPLINDMEWCGFFEEAVNLGGDPKQVWNWMSSEFAGKLNSSGQRARDSKITPAHIVGLAALVSSGRISSKMGKDVFDEMFRSGDKPEVIVEKTGASQITDKDEISKVVEEVLRAHPDLVAKYKGGQQTVKGFLVGQIMRQSKGRANPGLVQELLGEMLDGAGHV